MTTFSSTTGKTHVYRTKDIEKGPWTENSFRPALHDHSLFFDDDGRVYMIYGGGNLRLVELTADLSGIKPGGVNQVIITNASPWPGRTSACRRKAPSCCKINGKYYLFNITWPRGGMRTVIVHRADKITGPYEGRVALQDKGVAQGGLIDTPQGDWYRLSVPRLRRGRSHSLSRARQVGGRLAGARRGRQGARYAESSRQQRPHPRHRRLG